MTMMKVDVVGFLSNKRQLQLLSMSPNQRRKLLYQIGKEVEKQGVKRAKQQVDLKGKPYQEHHNKRRRKMLTRLVKRKNLRTRATALDAIIDFKNPYHGQIAAKQQRGHKQVIRSSEMKPKNKQFYDQPATRKQAKALIEAGFRVKKKSGKGKKKPTIKSIVENYTVGQAGYALSELRLWSGEQSKTSWVTNLPSRSFLGATAQDVQSHINMIFDTKKQELQHGIR
jgi:hypothetical protein